MRYRVINSVVTCSDRRFVNSTIVRTSTWSTPLASLRDRQSCRTMFSAIFGATSKIFRRKRDGAAGAGGRTVNGKDSKVTNGKTLSTDSDLDVEIVDCICASPLAANCGLTRASVLAEIKRWKDLAQKLSKNLSLPSDFHALSKAQKERIYQYYLPVYFWVHQQLEQHRRNKNASGPLIVGISAPQGCGKSTLCEQMEALLRDDNLVPASISIDDFYLTRKQQEKVSLEHVGNRLLQTRGNAMTHDLELGTKTLKALRNAKADSDPVPLPRYNKSAYQGKGDQADPSTWPTVQGPIDVVLFEGWMLGFDAVSLQEAEAVDADLVPINECLASYKDAWDSYVSSWLVVRVADPSFAHKWRLQAEHAMKAAGKDAMTDEEVARFVDRFMPAYRCYLPGLYSRGPTTARPGALLVVEVDESRSPATVQPKPVM